MNSDIEMPEDVMTQDAFNELLEYSSTLPTGTTIGKKWKRCVYGPGAQRKWFTGEYVRHHDPSLVGIVWRRLVISG